MRILTIFTGILLILTSIWCLAFSGTVFLSMAFVLGCVMVFAGICGCCAHFFGAVRPDAFTMMLAESIGTFVLGCVVLSNQLSTDAVVPLFFGMWVLFSGVTRLALAYSLRKSDKITWAWILALGVISTAVGTYSFFNQIAAGLAAMSLVGICFLLQGVNVLANGIHMPGKKRSKVL